MSHTHAAGACANCGAALHGGFCHQCGQSAHDPNRSFLHALEEVVESFWHLDGRVFRTLRALLTPGRPAGDFLAGHRVPFVAPMRLFVVLSVLTFFVARLALHAGHESPASPEAPAAPAQAAGDRLAGRFAALDQPMQVRALRDSTRDELQHALDEVPDGIGKRAGQASMQLAITHVEQLADARLVQLGQPAESKASTAVDEDASNAPVKVDFDLLPDFANRWLSVQAGHIQHNLPRLQQDPTLLFNAFLASVPSALFVLVPVFALLLRLFYVGSGWHYLQHLVVALYSHAFLLLDLLVVMALAIVAGWLAPHAPGLAAALAWPQWLLVLWMPVYLWLAQRRVYRQGRRWTTLKYLVLGSLYAVVVGLAAAWLMLLSLAHL